MDGRAKRPGLERNIKEHKVKENPHGNICIKQIKFCLDRPDCSVVPQRKNWNDLSCFSTNGILAWSWKNRLSPLHTTARVAAPGAVGWMERSGIGKGAVPTRCQLPTLLGTFWGLFYTLSINPQTLTLT